MYKLKNAAKRGGALLTAVGMLAGIGTSVLPASVFADALNPLTERSLTLSSSSPGWSYLDGSGNTTYAPPHSGANGQKTGETFSFRMSSNSETIQAITFQFCTSPAGNCLAPGDNADGVGTGTIDLTSGSAAVTGTGTDFDGELNVGSTIVTAGSNTYTVLSIASDTSLTLTANASATETGVAFDYRQADTTSTSDLNVVTSTPGEIAALDWDDGVGGGISNSADKTPAADGSEGNFIVLWADSTTPPSDWGDYTQDTGWSMVASNDETGTVAAQTATGRNNMITITSASGQAIDAGDYFKVIFFGTDDNYITNPGSGAFFVRMNTYNDDSTLDDTTIVDGGVTVANVMNESISIQTKVLETMDFSVGTHDPATYNTTDDTDYVTNTGYAAHAQCRALLMKDPDVTPGPAYTAAPHNVLQLGDPNAEYSLRTDTAYAVESYWRLSSNSSGGATVYYTGHTLTNTVGDEIAPLEDQAAGGPAGGVASDTGTEQFGLAIATDTSTLPIGPGGSSVESYPVWNDSYNTGTAGGTFANYVTTEGDDAFVHLPRLYPLIPVTDYANGAGTLGDAGTKFAFNANADSYAIPIATESDQVVNCVTAKMRYIANIAATTPAGIYTTKVNYVASPQY